jgi:hypothetical protein
LNQPAFDQILRRLTSAAHSRSPVIWLGGQQVAIETELGRLDIVQGLDGVPSYAELSERSVEADVLGVAVSVCAVEDLKRMKRAAGRSRDIADQEDLEDLGAAEE